jgi:transposase
VAYFYLGGDRDQLLLLPTSMREWLAEGHLAWFVIDVVAEVDTAAFHVRHPNDGPGRPAYDPDMMLALLFYAYGTGVRSSRRIEAACRTDAAYRVICGGATPDHATIARFVVDHQAAIEAVFVDVLRLCAAAGLVSVGRIALDGTKIGADAALDANRNIDWIRAEVARMLDEARATDATDDTHPTLFGGDQLPAPLHRASRRLARLQEAKAQLETQDAAARAEAVERAAMAAAAAQQGRRIAGRRPADPDAALARAEADVQAIATKIDNACSQRAARQAAREEQAAAHGRRPKGPKATDQPTRRERRQLEHAEQSLAAARAATQTATPHDRQANITDPDSRIMKTPTGWVQGYNAQAVVNDRHIVLACDVTQDARDVHQYAPMIATVIDMLTAAGITDPIGTVLADAGYWSDNNATTNGPDRLIATLKDWKQRQAVRDLGQTSGPPPQQASPLEAMEHRLRTPDGAHLYAQRSCTIEPVFGNHKENRGYRRFRRRGLAAARSEWSLINSSHNLTKLFAQPTNTTPTPT